MVFQMRDMAIVYRRRTGRFKRQSAAPKSYLPGCKNDRANSELLRGDPVRSHIRTQRFRYRHAAIGLLGILQDRQPGATDRQPAPIQRVHILTLLAAFGAIANIRAPSLIGFKIRAGRNLAIELLARQPDFEIVRLGRTGSHVTGTEQHGAIWQSKLLQNRLSVARELLML